MFRIIFNISLSSPYLVSVYITFINTVLFIQSFAPTTHYNLPRCRDFLADLFIEKANAMLWICSSAEADLEALLETFY